jgi:hypothetical protein
LCKAQTGPQAESYQYYNQVIDILAAHFMLQSIYLYYSCVDEQGDPWASKVSSTEGD